MSETANPAIAPAIAPAVMEAGKQQFMLCQACHGATGLGTEMIAPPLAGSEWVAGPAENLIRIQLRGLTGPIEVKGKEYTFMSGMPPQFFQTDEQIANVLTFVRNSFGNQAPAVVPADVLALRSEVGKPQLTMADLVPPVPKKAETDKAAPETDQTPEAGKSETATAEDSAPETPAAAESTATAAAATTEALPPPPPGSDSPPALALPVWAWLLAAAWLAVCLLPILRRK